jgi:hypothetical protein
MDPDAPWQRSQEAAARKAVETTDAAWPDDGRGSLMAEEAMNTDAVMCMALTSAKPSRTPLSFKAASTCGVMLRNARRPWRLEPKFA